MDRTGRRYDGAFVATIGGIVDRLRDRDRALDLDEGDRLVGRTCLVTGANRGLGVAVATELTRRGAHMILACRSDIPGALSTVRRAANDPNEVEGLHLDLGDLANVEAAVDALEKRNARVDVLVLNAGIVPREARKTRDDLDESFQVNFLSNVLLVRRLLERGVIRRESGRAVPRIVVVSSESHRSAPPIDWARFGTYRTWGMREAVEQYGYGKLLLQTFTEELVRRLDGQMSVHSMCPGAVRTDIGREAPRWAKPALDLTMRAFFKAPEDAAIPVVYLAAARSIEGKTGLYLHAKVRRDSRTDARDPESGSRIWNEAERILADKGHPLADAAPPAAG